MKRVTLVIASFFTFFCFQTGFAQTWVLYGQTYSGGTNNLGTLFRYELATGKDTVLVNFTGSNGSKPYSNMTLSPDDGMLYGVTTAGGTKNGGVLYSYDPVSGKDSVRMSFDSANGAGPEYGGMTYYNSQFYSMTLYGGQNNFGVLYSFNPVTGKDSVYASFDTLGQAYYPAGNALTPYSNGLLYGTTYAGGTYNEGTIISFNTTTGLYNTVVSLDTALGIFPIEGTLALDKTNNLLYGLTYQGGANNLGGIFCFNPTTGKDTLLDSFNGPNGSSPYGSLMYDTVNGLFYGMTSAGGAASGGVLFSFDPTTNKDSTLFSFTGANGAVPLGDLVLGPNNNLYGMTLYGGTYNVGVIFRYNTVTNQDTILLKFIGAIGAKPYGSLTLVQAPQVLGATGIDKENKVFAYPNPGSNFTNLVFSQEGKHQVEIDDMTGRKQNYFECTGKQYRLSLGGLSQGIYIIRSFNPASNKYSVSRLVVE